MTEFGAGFVIKAIVFTLAYGLIGAIFPLQGSPTITYLLGVLATGFSYALPFGFALTRMSTERKGRIFSVWISVYVIQFFNPLIEGYFFTNLLKDATQFLGGALFGAILALVYAIIAGLLFAPKQATSSLMDGLKNFARENKASDWIWRVIAAAFSWPLFYFLFGAAAAPIVTPYYTDPSLGYNLVFPSLETILLVQTLRGFIYVGALLPLIAFLKVETKHLFLVIFGFLYIGGGIAIFMIVETFPPVLRIAHGFGDLLAASLMSSAVIAYLFRKKERAKPS